MSLGERVCLWGARNIPGEFLAPVFCYSKEGKIHANLPEWERVCPQSKQKVGMSVLRNLFQKGATLLLSSMVNSSWVDYKNQGAVGCFYLRPE